MVPFPKVLWSRVVLSWGMAPLLVATSMPFSASAQTPADAPEPASQPETTNGSLKPLNQPDSSIGVVAGQRLLTEAEAAIAAQDYDQAISKLQAARENLQATAGYYQQLFNAFTGIDTRIADSVRAQAVEAAQLRDQATFQQALAYRAQNKPELAVPLLVEIIQSQNPGRDLGQRAYSQLFELGFVELNYPRGSE